MTKHQELESLIIYLENFFVETEGKLFHRVTDLENQIYEINRYMPAIQKAFAGEIAGQSTPFFLPPEVIETQMQLMGIEDIAAARDYLSKMESARYG